MGQPGPALVCGPGRAGCGREQPRQRRGKGGLRAGRPGQMPYLPPCLKKLGANTWPGDICNLLNSNLDPGPTNGAEARGE